MCGAHVNSKGYVCKAAQIPVRNNVGGPTNCSQVVLIVMPQSFCMFSLCIKEQIIYAELCCGFINRFTLSYYFL